MTRRTRVPGILLTGCAVYLLAACAMHAMWAITSGEPVPVERLVTNIQKYIAAHPNDAQGYYMLGRVHSRAFAENTATLTTFHARGVPVGVNPDLPDIAAPWDSVLHKRSPAAPPLDAAARAHLTESVRNYFRAVELAPQEALYYLGLGWMLEQGIPYARHVHPPFSVRSDAGEEAA